jgi:CRISPR-associated protein Cmr4
MLFEKKLTQVCVMYAVSPVHAGSGQAVSAVDLPIQRERHTGWPQVQSSGMKGAFRDWFYRHYLANPGADWEDSRKQAEELTKKVFGREESGGIGGHAGAISVTDARILAFPVRSNIAPFVWVTCPAVLKRLERDLALCPQEYKIPVVQPDEEKGLLVAGAFGGNGDIVLEDMALTPEESADTEAIRTIFETLAPQVERLLLVSDENFGFLVKTATEVQPQIQIRHDTGTTKDGSLRYQELLPTDSVLYNLVFFSSERVAENPMQAEMMCSWLKGAISTHVQIGGDMTMGRGLMEIKWVGAE